MLIVKIVLAVANQFKSTFDSMESMTVRGLAEALSTELRENL